MGHFSKMTRSPAQKVGPGLAKSLKFLTHFSEFPGMVWILFYGPVFVHRHTKSVTMGFLGHLGLWESGPSWKVGENQSGIMFLFWGCPFFQVHTVNFGPEGPDCVESVAPSTGRIGIWAQIESWSTWPYLPDFQVSASQVQKSKFQSFRTGPSLTVRTVWV